MLEKSIVDSLIHNAMVSVDIDAIKDVGDLQNVLCAQLNSSSGISSWKWQVGERYVTTGTTNKKSMTFSISGVYNDSVKVVIALVRVMDPPGNYLAFPYDVLRNCVRVELAISENSGTASTIDSLPVVYGVSIGLTDYAPYWVSADKGQDGWSRESFKLLREQVTNFRSVATIIESDQGDLHNAIYRGERCHLSFALNWSIMWRNLEGGSRYVYAAPSSVVEHPDEGVFMYDHDRGDPSFLPFLEVQTQEQWKREHDKIVAKQRSLIGQKASVKAKEKFVSAHGPEMAGQSKNRLMNKIDIDREREQVLLHWQHIDPDALLKQTHQIIQHINGKEPGHRVRAFHNLLGYKAMYGVETGGKCAGCFYRSKSFMELKQVDRVSEKKHATIHLEHLIPVKALVEKIRVLLSRGASAAIIQRFLLHRLSIYCL